MKDRAIRWVIGLGLVAILGMLFFQVYWVIVNFQNKQEAVEQQINIVLYKAAEGLAEYNRSVLPREDLINRRSSNYFIVNINDVIDANVLEFYLLEEMRRVGLEMDFEYAIYDCEKDQMVYGHYCDIDELPAQPANSNLPKYDEFDYYFGVRFPQMRNKVLDDMTMSFVLAGLLLITLLFFGVALYIIMTQKRLSDLQRDFINNMTHELKTPLSSIKIAGDTFLHHEIVRNDSRLYKYAEIVSDQSGRLNEHVEKILDVARLEGDLVKLNPEEFDLINQLNEIIESFRAQYSDSSVKFSIETDLQYAEIYADPLHSKNVFYNLIDNAIKYGGKPPKIDVKVIKQQSSINVVITDNGIGIDKKELGKIFDKFYRISTGDVHNTKGFGLGLYYVQRIAQLQKWSIDVVSELGNYTTFTLTIPKRF